MIQVNLQDNVHKSHLIQWLHDHVGACERTHGFIGIQGDGWHMESVAGFNAHTMQLYVHAKVEFHPQVSPDVIMQFVLTWS